MPRVDATSTVENKTLENCLEQKIRLDGRNLFEYREISFRFPNKTYDGCCIVRLGGTSIISKATYDIVEPRSTRPYSDKQTLRSHEDEARRLSNVLQSALRDSIDLDSFCIVAWESVFSIKIDLKVLSFDGNVADCGALAAIASLSTFKRPGVYVNEKGKVVVDQEGKIRPKVKIQLRRIPVLVSFGLTNNSELILVDPNAKEESNLITSRVMVGMTADKEVCCLHTSHLTTMITKQLLQNCVMIAGKHARALVALLKFIISNFEKEVALVEKKLSSRQSEVDKAEASLLACPMLMSSRNFLRDPTQHEMGELYQHSDDEDDAMSISSEDSAGAVAPPKVKEQTSSDPYGVIELSLDKSTSADSSKRKHKNEVGRPKKRALLNLLEEEEHDQQETVLTLI